MAVAGSIRGRSSKFVVVACYLPRNYTRIRGNDALDYVEGVMVDLKRKFRDQFITIAGDFNQWKIDKGLPNFAAIREVPVGSTRGNRSIDRIFFTMNRSVTDCGTLDS